MRASRRSPTRPTSASDPSTITSTAKRRCSKLRQQGCPNAEADDRRSLRRHHRPGRSVLAFAAAFGIARRPHPEVARFITGAGLDLLEAPRGLAPRALRDVEAGQPAGQFTVPVAEVALSVIAGGLIGLLRRRPERSETSRRNGSRPARRSVPPPTWPSRTQGQTPRRTAASDCRVLVTVIP